ncbi:MAG: ATP-binding cassette domain-containing protein [Nitrospirae bacterium]|nr:MAG: ATP-binding cassette domain-containing protein [Nitrospirota bacterium]
MMELLRVDSLKKHFGVRKAFRTPETLLKAVDGVDFSLSKDSVLAIVGESGCGKSTLARLVLRLLPPTSGKVLFKGEDVFALGREGLKGFRKSVQIIFQDPFASLNPRRTVYETISEPLTIHNLVKRPGLRDAVAGILDTVGMGPDVMGRYPHEFSGGQRQRICIARALAVSPEMIIADEPLSALDVSIQAQIINLLLDLKKKTGISFLFISHDLRVVHYLSDEVAVMYLGKIVEHARSEELFEKPFHPYTEMLLASAPVIKREDAGKGRTVHAAPLKGEAPSPFNLPSGCPFHPRCPRRFEPCDKIVPLLRENSGRLVSCHLWNSPE